MSYTTWKTQDGQEIEVSDMGDTHLLNAFRMLERNAEGYKERELSAGYSLWGVLQGEQANWDIERDISRLEETDPIEFLEDYFPVYKAMKSEIERRGLSQQDTRSTKAKKNVQKNA